MATCEQVKGFVQAYLDGELPQSEQVVFEQHLSECGRCRATMERQRESVSLLIETFAPYRLADSLTAAVMAHLPEMEAPRPSRRDSGFHTTPHPERKRKRVWALIPALVPVILLVLGLAIAYSWPPLVPELGRTIGKVTFVDGKAHRALAGSTLRTDVALKESVFAGQRYSTSSASRMMLALAGPTFVKLNVETRIKVNDERSISLESGKIWLDVGEDGRHFQVNTPNGTVTVFGTEFEVQVEYDRTVVTVAEGEVQVENDRAFTVLRADRQVEVLLGKSHLQPQFVDAKSLLAWGKEIKSDSDAEESFWADVQPLEAQQLPGEQVFAVRTMGKTVASVVLEWDGTTNYPGHCGYVMYISDDKMEPLYRGVVDASLFSKPSQGRHELAIEGSAIQGVDVIHIKVVPDSADGGCDSAFTGISAVGQ